MKMNQRGKAVLFCLILALSLSGCYQQTSGFKIELIVKGTSTEFWQSVYDGAKSAAMIYEVEVTSLGPAEEKDYAAQVDILRQAVVRKPDAVILAAADYNMMADPVEEVVSAGIPIIVVDSMVNSDRWISFVSTDNKRAGESLGEELLKRVEKPGKVGVVSFVRAAFPSADREEGFLSSMKNVEDLNLLETVYCDSNFDIAQQLTENMVQENPDLVAIAGLNAQAATGAARALDKLNRPDILLVGIDCTVEEAAFMEKDILDVAILQNPYLMGYYSLEATAKYLSSGRIEKNIWIDTRVIDKENMFLEENQQLIFPFEKGQGE
jgi:ribose transport system substrate-binding protein